jgi:hypothetical protein
MIILKTLMRGGKSYRRKRGRNIRNCFKRSLSISWLKEEKHSPISRTHTVKIGHTPKRDYQRKLNPQ